MEDTNKIKEKEYTGDTDDDDDNTVVPVTKYNFILTL